MLDGKRTAYPLRPRQIDCSLILAEKNSLLMHVSLTDDDPVPYLNLSVRPYADDVASYDALPVDTDGDGKFCDEADPCFGAGYNGSPGQVTPSESCKIGLLVDREDESLAADLDCVATFVARPGAEPVDFQVRGHFECGFDTARATASED